VKKKIANYKILKELGQGGMATVYLGIQKSLEREVAIKELLPSLINDEEMVERFKREAKASASLTHEGIVSVYDFWKDQKSLYLVMEYLAGKTLDEIIAARGHLPVPAAVAVTAKIADALHYSHQRGIVHRDVKPSNIFVTRRGEVKLTDFGIAYTPQEPTLTQKGIAIGTPAYMSPEQVKGERPDGRSDIFSLGIVLYELVTGVRPFIADDFEGVITKILQNRPRWPKLINKEVPWRLQWIILRCIRKNPRRRFQNMGDLKIALEKLLPRTSHRRDQVLSQFIDTVFSNGEETPRESLFLSKTWKWAFPAAAIAALLLGYYGLRNHGIRPHEKQDSYVQGEKARYSPSDYGRIKIVAYPWARIYVDGKYVTTTPTADPVVLVPGRHSLRFTHSTFGSKTMEIDLNPGEERLIIVKMGS